MPSVDVVNFENKKTGSIDLADAVFAAKINHALIHQVIKAQLNGMRQGTAKTKTKGEVRGGGRKPYKQKGTGNARRGSSRSPLIPGGGTIFGPIPRDYSERTNKKMVQGALRSALTDRLSSQKLLVIDSMQLKEVKTKALAQALRKGLSVESALLVDSDNRNLELAGRNIHKVRVVKTKEINVLDIVRHEWLLLSKTAAAEISKRFEKLSRGQQ